MRYFIIAGEASGDNYAKELYQGLQMADPQAVIHYFGPDSSSAVMGFIEVLAKAGSLLKRLAACKRELLAFAPDVLILIDYPTFNMQMAGFANRHHIKTFYYLAPKVWASREGRVRKMRRVISRLYVIFPFETDYFNAKGIPSIYLGNPILDTLQPIMESDDSETDNFRREYKLSDAPILAILPGSRMAEINFTLPRAAAVIKEFPDHQWIVAGVHSILPEVYDRYLSDLPARVIYGNTHRILRQAVAAIVTSGTATLEAALLGCPQVVCYGGNPLSVAIARKIIRINHIALPDIILGKNTVHELVQKDCTPEHLTDELLSLLPGRQRRRSVLADYKQLQKLLGTPGATLRVARDMVETLTGITHPPIYKICEPTPFGFFCFTANLSGTLTGSFFAEDTAPGCYLNDHPLEGEPVPTVLQQAVTQLHEYLEGKRRAFDLPMQIEGTEFQKTVWQQLATIPYGTTCSYSDLAVKCGSPKAARAVGQANNANPFALIIPCHRVIGNDGSLVGYAGGLDTKQKILAMEKTYAPESTNSLF